MQAKKVETFTFYSNFLMHHQLPFCLEMVKRFGEGFTFVATEDTDKELKAFWKSEGMNEKYPFVLKAYESEKIHEEALRLARESDIVVVGSAPEEYIKYRMKVNKLTFRYTERPLKKSRWELFRPRKFRAMLRMHTANAFKKLHLLCASAYTAGDCALVGGYWRRAYKWGYFTEVKKYDSVEGLIEKKRSASILWAGRLIKWKHPELAIKVAKRLKENGISFTMNIIGTGPLEQELATLIEQYDLTNCVYMLGSMTPERVREYMERSQIFMFTSDRNEGWGAVLNESMNSCCAVVADRHIGSVPFLLQDGVNGFIYNGNEGQLYEKVKHCLEEPALMAKLGENAYQTMQTEWCPAVAAERIVTLAEALLNGQKNVYKEGPCSRAKWM